jgi:hypothetical protein
MSEKTDKKTFSLLHVWTSEVEISKKEDENWNGKKLQQDKRANGSNFFVLCTIRKVTDEER